MGHDGRGQFSCYPAARAHSRAELMSAMGDEEASTSGYIDHTVSRLDTLAGVAIKYGVEVADVKRFNGLTTDLQMFALKTLRIPTPGRHPPSAVALASSSQSRCEPSFGKHEKSSTMELLRDYYGLPSGVKISTVASGTETDIDHEVFVPMFRPPNATVSERYDFKPSRCGYVRESCNNLLVSCWSAESSRVLKSGKKVVMEGDSLSKERPIRRRTRSDLDVVSERVNFPKRDPAPRPKDFSRFGSVADEGASSGIKSAVEGLLFKVMQTASPQEMSGKPLSERVPSTGSFSVLEGITSAYRHAKAALD